jgi:hypothetical protein
MAGVGVGVCVGACAAAAMAITASVRVPETTVSHNAFVRVLSP